MEPTILSAGVRLGLVLARSRLDRLGRTIRGTVVNLQFLLNIRRLPGRRRRPRFRHAVVVLMMM